jgi:hypothetical protein
MTASATPRRLATVSTLLAGLFLASVLGAFSASAAGAFPNYCGYGTYNNPGIKEKFLREYVMGDLLIHDVKVTWAWWYFKKPRETQNVC